MKAHKRLKIRATQWLQNEGYVVSPYEGIFGKERIDVIGEKSPLIVGVECGNTPHTKLLRLTQVLDILYVWLYGATAPIIFSGQKLPSKRSPNSRVNIRWKPQYIHQSFDLSRYNLSQYDYLLK